MAIAANCPGCSTPFEVPEDLAGKTIRCTMCSQGFVVPASRALARIVPPGFEPPKAATHDPDVLDAEVLRVVHIERPVDDPPVQNVEVNMRGKVEHPVDDPPPSRSRPSRPVEVEYEEDRNRRPRRLEPRVEDRDRRPRRRRSGRGGSGGMNPAWLLVGFLGGFLLLASLGAGIYFLAFNGTKSANLQRPAPESPRAAEQTIALRPAPVTTPWVAPSPPVFTPQFVPPPLADEWQVLRGTMFEVEMPGPAQRVIAPGFSSTSRWHCQRGDDLFGAHSTSYTSFPPKTPAELLQTSLDNNRFNPPPGFLGKSLRYQNHSQVTISDVPGLLITYDAPDSPVRGLVWIGYTRRRKYLLYGMGTDFTPENERVKRFLGSLKVIENFQPGMPAPPNPGVPFMPRPRTPLPPPPPPPR